MVAEETSRSSSSDRRLSFPTPSSLFIGKISIYTHTRVYILPSKRHLDVTHSPTRETTHRTELTHRNTVLSKADTLLNMKLIFPGRRMRFT